MAETETLETFLDGSTFSPEGAVQDRIARFNILSRLQVLDEISDADFDLAA